MSDNQQRPLRRSFSEEDATDALGHSGRHTRPPGVRGHVRDHKQDLNPVEGTEHLMQPLKRLLWIVWYWNEFVPKSKQSGFAEVDSPQTPHTARGPGDRVLDAHRRIQRMRSKSSESMIHDLEGYTAILNHRMTSSQLVEYMVKSNVGHTCA